MHILTNDIANVHDSIFVLFANTLPFKNLSIYLCICMYIYIYDVHMIYMIYIYMIYIYICIYKSLYLYATFVA